MTASPSQAPNQTEQPSNKPSSNTTITTNTKPLILPTKPRRRAKPCRRNRPSRARQPQSRRAPCRILPICRLRLTRPARKRARSQSRILAKTRPRSAGKIGSLKAQIHKTQSPKNHDPTPQMAQPRTSPPNPAQPARKKTQPRPIHAINPV